MDRWLHLGLPARLPGDVDLQTRVRRVRPVHRQQEVFLNAEQILVHCQCFISAMWLARPKHMKGSKERYLLGDLKKRTLATHLRDTSDRVQFKLLMALLMQSGVSLTLTRWTAGALPETTMVTQLGNWTSAPHQPALGLPQAPSPILYNVHTKDLADLNRNGSSKVFTPTGS